MGLTPSNLRLLIELHSELGFDGPVLSLGNQEVYASAADLSELFRAAGARWREPAVIHPHTSAAFRRHWPEKARDFVHARTFFDMLGLDGYTDVDRYPDDEPTLLADLNRPLPEELREGFGLVLDSGTLEHVFDVRQGVENVMRALRTGGRVVHFNPAADVDHGFYSFSPTLYFDCYRANGFDDMRCLIQLLDPADLMAPCPTFPYAYGMPLTGLLDPERVPLVCFTARKTRPVERLEPPTQGMYDPASGWPSGEERAAAAPDIAPRLL